MKDSESYPLTNSALKNASRERRKNSPPLGQLTIMLLISAMVLSGCGGNNSQSNNDSATTELLLATSNIPVATLNIDAAAAGSAVNTALLGSNIEWVHNGDGLVSSNAQPRAAVVDAAKQLGPTSLRYPGGSLADTYHWRDGIGPIANRGRNRDLSNQSQQVIFGTDEFLQLASSLSSVPVITINVMTGDAKEAADWVRYVNGGVSQQPQVKYWEIGNEPYLKEDARPDLAITPTEYANRANLAITAMKIADPRIKIGIPLRSDTIGGVFATPYQGYNRTVLSNVKAPIDFVAVHNAYFPFAYTSVEVNDQDLFSAAMAASDVLAADLDATSAQMQALRPSNVVPIALTEYNALFGLSTPRLLRYSTSLAGALYVADTLHLLTNRDDILGANFWSLTSNGYFGTMDESGHPRPAYYVLQMYRLLLQGQLIPAQMTSPFFANPQVGAVPSGTNRALINATVTRSNKVLRIAVLNKHSSSNVKLTVKMKNGTSIGTAKYYRLSGEDLFAGSEGRPQVNWGTGTLATGSQNLELDLPAHSFTIYEIPLV